MNNNKIINNNYALNLDGSWVRDHRYSPEPELPPPFSEPLPVHDHCNIIIDSPAFDNRSVIEMIDYTSIMDPMEAFSIINSGEINLIALEIPKQNTPKQFLPSYERAPDPNSRRPTGLLSDDTHCCYVLAVPSKNEIQKLSEQNQNCLVPLFRFARSKNEENINHTDNPLINSFATSLTIAGQDIFCVELLCSNLSGKKEWKKKRTFSPSNPVQKHYIHTIPKEPIGNEWLIDVYRNLDRFFVDEYRKQQEWADRKIEYEKKRSEIINKLKEDQIKKIDKDPAKSNPCKEIELPDLNQFISPEDIKESKKITYQVDKFFFKRSQDISKLIKNMGIPPITPSVQGKMLTTVKPFHSQI